MTRAQIAIASVLATLIGGVLFFYLIFFVPPRFDEGEINPLALIGFFTALILLVGGLGALTALVLHERWPALAGASARNRKDAQPNPVVALRQGGLLALVSVVLVALSMLRLLDPAFVVVTLLVGGLLEAYFQRG